MLSLATKIRPLLIGFVVLALSAGVALASQPAQSASGLDEAASSSGRTVPAAGSAGSEQADADKDDADKDEADKESAEANDNCSTDPTKLTAEKRAALTHGQIVCWAAHQTTPAGYDNHGDWVSSFAKDNAGADSKPAAAAQDRRR